MGWMFAGNNALDALLTNPDFFVVGSSKAPVSWSRSSIVVDPLTGDTLAAGAPSMRSPSIGGVAFPTYLQQGTRVNLVQNPSCAGASTDPTVISTFEYGLPGGWTFSQDQQVMSVVGHGPHPTVPGAYYVDIRYHNTSGVESLYNSLQFEQNRIYVSAGQEYTVSCYVQLVAGSIPSQVVPSMGQDWSNSSGGYYTTGFGNLNAPISSTMGRRWGIPQTVPSAGSVASATAAFYTGRGVSGTGIPNGADFTIRFMIPQCELALHPSSPIITDWQDPTTAGYSTRASTRRTRWRQAAASGPSPPAGSSTLM